MNTSYSQSETDDSYYSQDRHPSKSSSKRKSKSQLKYLSAKKTNKIKHSKYYRQKYYNNDPSEQNTTGYYDYLLEKNNSSYAKADSKSASASDSNAKIGLQMFFTGNATTSPQGDPNKEAFEYVIDPRYLFNEKYSLGFRLEGEYDFYDTPIKHNVDKGFFHLTREPFAFSRSFTFSPSLTLYVPVNSNQVNNQSYQFGVGTKLILGMSDKASFKDYVQGQFQLIAHKGYYEYKTVLNDDPTAPDNYNVNYTIQEKFFPEFHIYSRFWAAIYEVFTEKIDYDNKTTYKYSTDLLLKTVINENMDLYTGIETADNLYDANNKLQFTYYDPRFNITRWQVGIMAGF